MCVGKVADIAANVIWKILIRRGQVKVKSRHIRASLERAMLDSAPNVASADQPCA
jgi:hypothetical protein